VNSLAPLMSSVRDSWNTPANVLDLVRELGPIGLDPCGNADSIVDAAEEWTLERDGDSLVREWAPRGGQRGLIYVNPPYGRQIGAWVEKCRRASVHGGGEVVALVPSRTDTAWWNASCVPPQSDAVCFWRGRLTFLGAPHPAPFPSAIVYWGARRFRFAEVFGTSGPVWVRT